MVAKKKHRLAESYIGGSVVNRNGSKCAKTQEPTVIQAKDVYYEEGDLQRVHPYFHKFATHAKGRWIGRTIYEVFTKEFRDRSAQYYGEAIAKGLIEINGKQVSQDTVVRNGDLVTHFVHRHEPPVTLEPLGIVRETEDGLLIVNKPGSVPVHPSGRYNYNSVTKILEIKHGYKALFPVNRLDRLTSGLLLVGLNVEMARKLEQNLLDHVIQKEYVCKVIGEFPEGKVVCDQPIRVVAHKLSLNCVDPADGKPSLTEFERLSSDGTHSIVYCRPKTGRTHQIRVHLQFLGYPIANDPLYHNVEVWGDAMGRGGAMPESTESLAPAKECMGEVAVKKGPRRRIDTWKSLVKRMEDWKTKQEMIEHVEHTSAGADLDDPRTCSKCANVDLPNPKPDELCIWLHAWRYSGPGWSYETPLPEWAREAAAKHIDRVKYNP
ncbi:DRAP deaminase [Coemansia sp. RSA 552]|nr:DRAP deaminase [Coemansia sp. RSA 552]